MEAEVRLVCAGETVIEEGLTTWLDSVAMVARVVAGVTREALALATPPPARLDDTVPVTVPRVVTPFEKKRNKGIRGEHPARPKLAWRSKTFKTPHHTCFQDSPVVPLTTRVVTVGLTAETDTGVTRRTPAPMGTVRKMVPGCPGAPFRTTCKDKKGKLCSKAVKHVV